MTDALRRLTRRQITAGLLALAAVFFIYTGYKFWLATNGYLNIYLTDNQQVVLYAMGYPDAVRDGENGDWIKTQPVSIALANSSSATALLQGKNVFGYRQWAYNLPQGGQGQFAFERGSGRVSRISCMHPEALPGACPSVLGVKLGDDEDRAVWTLGAPRRAGIEGLTKTIYYDDIGVEYALERRRVYEIGLRRGDGGFFSRTIRYFRSLVP